LSGLARGLPAATFLSSSLLLINAAQMGSLLLLPVSRSAFRRFNRLAADTWWGWSVSLAKHLYDTHVVLSGDELPARENAIVLANHQQMTDITFLMFLARAKGRLGDMKWLVKDVIKFVPGVGWGMLFLDCVFVKRNWAADRASIEATFARLNRDRVPVWLLSFPEGTRITPDKHASSCAFARERGIEPFHELLVPRTKGFCACVRGLRGHVDAVYDVTIGYPHGVPGLWQYTKGFATEAHLHVRRYAIAELPEADDALAAWLMARFREKDVLLRRFRQEGCFAPGEPSVAERERDRGAAQREAQRHSV